MAEPELYFPFDARYSDIIFPQILQFKHVSAQPSLLAYQSLYQRSTVIRYFLSRLPFY